jgi:hypothetical protein
MIRLAFVAAPVLIFSGCTCNQDYAFPQNSDVVVEGVAADGPWLSMDSSPAEDQLTLTFYDRENGACAFAIGTPTDNGDVQWSYEKVDGYKGDDGLDRADRGHYTSHKVAPDGTVWVAYRDAVNGGLFAAQRTAPHVWEVHNVELTPGAGHWASLALDSDGKPVIAHYDADARTLLVSRTSSEGWSTETVHTGAENAGLGDTGVPFSNPADVGEYAKIIIHEGIEFIAFYDRAWGTLNVLEGAGGTYAHTEVDNQGDVGQWPSLWTDGNTVRIAYHDITDQQLLMATRESGTWSRSTIDTGDYTGADSEIFQIDNKFAVVYFDGFNNDQKLARLDGGNWTTEKIVGDGVAAGFHNEAAYAAGKWWLASYDFTNQAMTIGSL